MIFRLLSAQRREMIQRWLTFTAIKTRSTRGGKIAAEIFCALILGAFCIAFFGLLGGLAAFIILETALVGVDFLVPDEDATPGAVIR